MKLNIVALKRTLNSWNDGAFVCSRMWFLILDKRGFQTTLYKAENILVIDLQLTGSTVSLGSL
jgi:hypothetical protein